MTSASASVLPTPPLPVEKTRLAAELVQGLDAASLNWLSGYMAGAASQLGGLPAAAVPANQSDERLTVLYGSQTGNAKRVAEDLAQRAEKAGLTVQLVRADAYKPRDLKKERLLYVVISTHSEGDEIDPPDDSRGFMEFLLGKRAPKLPELRYAVLALGDTSYPDFCGIGRQVDERLADLGATRLFDRGEADVDVDSVAEPWTREALDKAGEALAPNAQPAPAASSVVTPLHPATQSWTRQRPFAAEILVNQRIVANDSGKDVCHVELSLEGSGITYQPGDALGIWPRQADALVDAVVAELGLCADDVIEHGDDSATLRQWLTERRELTALTRPFIVAHAERGGHADLAAKLEPDARAELTDLLGSWQLLDLLRRWPTQWSATDLVAALRPLAPRMYSIASSQSQVEEEVHLTIANVHYQHDGEERWGVTTRHLSGLDEGDTVSVFVDHNDRFRLPADTSRDIIMIGPGTGIAPFRAFLQERQEQQADGRQWLFFGNPHRRTDFLYQLEWQQALRDGDLTRMSVAFSRDQENKVYVQDRLREEGAQVWSWLEGGAHLYLCGDADRMAPDVHAVLIDIVAEHGGKSREDATSWIKQLMADGRYARDVY
ncbi:MAG TPA: assimilatory sulfite reductase (NADPH) flavoprotein subunit [Oleiagrimonas sp.]|nr:assimilatory sulfite reductase (NADPH) flavoprotein subunit [Oleiagrimonas sp.]